MELEENFKTIDVWYDGSTGEFVNIEEGEDGNIVLMTPPYEGGSVIVYEFEDESEWESAKNDFMAVPEEALESPEEYFEQYIEENINSVEFDLGYEFARNVTEIVDTR